MKQFNSISKKFLAVAFVCCLLFSVFIGLLVTGQNSTAYADVSEKESNNISEEYVEVYSYEDVFEKYYGQVTNELSDVGIEIPFTYDDFCEGFYSNNLDIATYTNLVVEYTQENLEYFYNTDISLYDSSASSPDADYILKSKANYITTPESEFKRSPNYNGYNGNKYDFTCVREGDILYETKTILNVGHTAIVSDLDHNSYYGNYVQTIEAVGSGVSYGFLDDTRMVEYGVLVLRVPNSTPSMCAKAIEFCEGQVGKKYNLNIFRLNTSYYSESWYCSELNYAAYKYAGIDVGVKEVYGQDSYLQLGCLPSDIYYSYNTYVKGVIGKYYPDIQLLRKSGTTWDLKIYNNTNASVTVYYNSKMCFAGDASGWKNLKNVSSVSIASDGYAYVSVKENWFATDVAFSIVQNGTRFISYANQLTNQNNCIKMNIRYSKK